MRIWSLAPDLLDRRALVACWRETLLAQKVLLGRTTGYTRHPQLKRFRESADPIVTICHYLHGLADEADARGYNFDRSRVELPPASEIELIPVTKDQLLYELALLGEKVLLRDLVWHSKVLESLEVDAGFIPCHPSFITTPGGIESWEKVIPSIFKKSVLSQQ